jgi:hypothetical protein
MPAFKLATWACSRSQSRRNGVLGRAGKLDRNASGDNAFEFHANLVDTNGGASLVIDTNDGVRVDILALRMSSRKISSRQLSWSGAPFSGYQAEVASILPMV